MLLESNFQTAKLGRVPVKRKAPLVLVFITAILNIPASSQQLVYRIPVEGVIELGLAPFIARAIREATDAGAAAVVLDINTPGGRVDAAQRIVRAVTSATIPVYAYVNTHAWSAGAMIALAADSIFMSPTSSIGAATPVDGSGTKAPEKIVSAMRGEFRALAEARGLDPRIAESMVDEAIEVPGVVAAGQLLTLTSSEAIEVGVAVANYESLTAMLNALGYEGARQVTPTTNWAEALVRFLSNPVVAPLLLSIGVLGLLAEIKTPSFGVAGTIGVASLAAFFGSHLIIGLAGWEELILLGVGLVALALEVFVVPGFGIAGLIAMFSIGAAVFLALIGSLATWPDIARAAGIVMTAIVITTMTIYLVFRHLPTADRWGGVFLKAATAKAEGYIAAPARSDLVGLDGVAATDLHPSGVVIVGNERMDVVSEGGFVNKGSKVRFVQSDGYRHVVRATGTDTTA